MDIDIPTTYYVTETLPPQTTAVQEVDYTTYTTVCPVTETKTIGGQTVTVTYETTSTVVTRKSKDAMSTNSG